jgi:hypothetical protein
MHEIIQNGSGALNQVMLDIGKEAAQTILCVEQEELAGPDYYPTQDGIYKWAFEPGSIYLSDQKVPVMRPCLRGAAGEVGLKSYAQMKSPQGFSEQLLGKVLGGLSGRPYAVRWSMPLMPFGCLPADSLLEAFSELLTLHRLKFPALLRKTLRSTNPIEGLFSRVRSCEKNIKRYRSSAMSQRWLAGVLLYSEKGFKTVKGHEGIEEVMKNIEPEQMAVL